MTNDQVSGILDRMVAAGAMWLLTWLATKGFISQSDIVAFLPILVALPTAFVGWWKNRPKSIVQSAAALSKEGFPGTTVVTSPELAAATPESNIVSNVDQKVVSK